MFYLTSWPYPFQDILECLGLKMRHRSLTYLPTPTPTPPLPRAWYFMETTKEIASMPPGHCLGAQKFPHRVLFTTWWKRLGALALSNTTVYYRYLIFIVIFVFDNASPWFDPNPPPPPKNAVIYMKWRTTNKFLFPCGPIVSRGNQIEDCTIQVHELKSTLQ